MHFCKVYPCLGDRPQKESNASFPSQDLQPRTMIEQKYVLTAENWLLDSDEEPEQISKEERRVRKALKRGRWPEQERTFVNQLIANFKTGLLDDCADDTGLTMYLAGKLGCDPLLLSAKRSEPDEAHVNSFFSVNMLFYLTILYCVCRSLLIKAKLLHRKPTKSRRILLKLPI